jgi:hypothetical protein
MYYTIRTVFKSGEISYTSRTVGKYMEIFPSRTSSFSLPLEPQFPIMTSDLLTDMGANYIRWMDPVTHNWRQSVNTQMRVGEGYEVNFPSETKYTFTGLPGAMIKWDNVPFGFMGNADDINANVDPLTGNISLSWAQAPGISTYHIYNSTTRDGFWGRPGSDYNLLTSKPFGFESCLHTGAALAGPEQYYLIVPVSGVGERGSSCYSIGVWTGNYDAGYDTLALPLKLDSTQSIDWYCEAVDNTLGMNYYNQPEQRWMWHKTLMQAGVYDPDLEMCRGYQISTTTATKYSFVGI